MHKRHHAVKVDTTTVPSGHTWFDPRGESLKEELITLFVSTHQQFAAKVKEDTHPTDRNGLPYDWSERRLDVIERAGENIKDWVQPLGYVEAWSADPITNAGLSADARQAEIDYLASTQEQELAPQWLELRENGITALPFQMEWANEDISFGEQVTEEDAREMLIDYSIQGIKDGNRVEEFLRESDYAYVQHGLPERFKWVTNAEGKRGLAPQTKTPKMLERAKEALRAAIAADIAPSAEEIRAIAEYRTECAARAAHYGKEWRLSLLTQEEYMDYAEQVEADKWLDTLDPERLAIAAEYEAEEYERTRPKIGDPCPAECQDGRIIVGITIKPGRKTGEPQRLIDYDDCAYCNGRGTVMAALGFGQDIWEGVESIADTITTTIEDSMWELDFEELTK